MITASNTVKTMLEQDTTLVINSGCTFEYNMNTLVDDITMTGSTDTAGDNYKPFKKLFPIDTVVKPNRPLGAGIKYAIIGDIGQNSYRDPRVSDYPIDYRTYYPGAETAYKYYISQKGQGIDITASYPKPILANKIVIRFELSHATPPTWTVFSGATQIATGTSSAIKPFSTTSGTPSVTVKNSDAGTLILYWNGTAWTTTEPTTISAPVSMTSLKLTTGSVASKYIALIEMSPRWVIDISDRLIDFSINKEASSSSDEILPVGSVSANSLSMSMVSYEDTRQVLSFDKTMTFNSSMVYLYKRVEVSPYLKVYYPTAPLTDSYGKYEKIKQGVFYMDNWSIGEFGDVSLNALDGAKILQETIAPSLICKGYTTTAIIRNLLDSVGFTNYKFNTLDNDSSIFSPRFWWTDDGRTVWESIQQLCRDSQMIALFDENNILQFYTREYIFDSSSTTNPTDWTFRYSSSGNNLPNILSFEKQDLASANQVKVLWNSVTTNEYLGNAQPLWKSGNTFMGALALNENILASDGPGSYMSLSAVTTNQYAQGQILNEYSGFLVINSEIIEYDAVQYDYVDASNTTIKVDIENESDALKYLGLSKSGSSNFKPNGKYRIKQRGAFETAVADHKVNAQDVISSWKGYTVTWP